LFFVLAFEPLPMTNQPHYHNPKKPEEFFQNITKYVIGIGASIVIGLIPVNEAWAQNVESTTTSNQTTEQNSNQSATPLIAGVIFGSLCVATWWFMKRKENDTQNNNPLKTTAEQKLRIESKKVNYSEPHHPVLKDKGESTYNEAIDVELIPHTISSKPTPIPITALLEEIDKGGVVTNVNPTTNIQEGVDPKIIELEDELSDAEFQKIVESLNNEVEPTILESVAANPEKEKIKKITNELQELVTKIQVAKTDYYNEGLAKMAAYFVYNNLADMRTDSQLSQLTESFERQIGTSLDTILSNMFAPSDTKKTMLTLDNSYNDTTRIIYQTLKNLSKDFWQK